MRERGRKQQIPIQERQPAELKELLEFIGADDLRKIVLELLKWLDEPYSERFRRKLIDRASRNASGWRPPPPSPDLVAEAIAFAEESEHLGFADPEDMDFYLSEGLNAFVAGDYAAAQKILGRLLPGGSNREDPCLA